MAKKGLGKLAIFAAVTGAVAAGVSYVLQYKTFHKELDKDFREYEEDEEGAEEKGIPAIESIKSNRNYISLASSKDEFKVAAKDMAQATKNVLKDAGNLFSDTAHEAVSAAVDTAHIAIHTMKAKKDELMEGHEDKKTDEEDIFEDEGFLDDDYVDDDDLYDYTTLEGGNGRSFRTADSGKDDYSSDLMEEAPKVNPEDKAVPNQTEAGAAPAPDQTMTGETAQASTASEKPEPVKETATIEEDTL